MALSIGVDVGGTKIAAGVVDDEGKVLQTIRRDSPAADRQAIIDTITMVVRRLREDFPDVATVGIGAAGFVSSDRNTMAHGTNLDWTGMRIGDVVSEGVGLPVVVENDANAFGWAEARFGAARGKRNALIVAIGTGVGGAIIVDGHLLRGAAGFGGEIGHINVVPGGRPCGCGLRGCLERYSAGTALGVNAWELAQFRPDYAARIIELSGGIRPGHELKFWVPGGSSTPIFGPDELDVPLDYESVAEAGSMLGTRALQVFDETVSVVRVVTRWTEFYQHESCGKCTPCREGTYWMRQIMLRLEAGRGLPGDVEKLESIASNIAGRSFCALGDASATPVLTGIKRFREEFEAGYTAAAGELFPYAASSVFESAR